MDDVGSQSVVNGAFECGMSLDAESDEITTIYGEGRDKQPEPEPDALSRIVETLNERFGLDLDDAYKVLFDQFEEEWVGDSTLATQA